MRLCVIPARGGSKRIPRKNIRSFCGRPMIAWSICAARESGLFDQVVVSTDDPGIAAVSREWGADVPFARPPELADDHVGTAPVVVHAIDWYVEAGEMPGEVCCLYATAPFVRGADLVAAHAALRESGACFVFTATTFPFPILRSLTVDAHGELGPMFPEHIGKRSQDLPEAFHDAGQFYFGDARHWRDNVPMFGPRSRMFLLPRHRVQDIDTEEDWRRAEWLFRAMQEAGE
ncbi:pseudaminic acid cytidylyltransferase [Niveibacterium umoris]|uniref:N-acylneuraminate cytidylyltransferase n=1 Tax=Niveibacterium umoris TaxID=1193620 RepID=A0A840BHY7_9RHOO|nr:pseudaminic acid cytidylyltransferase [Niveibacterium umoris]MBB4011914.1 N-acylneuraminate cytidylyltransferase [Niveibacterium umoris]